jgi:hypothetical protein
MRRAQAVALVGCLVTGTLARKRRMKVDALNSRLRQINSELRRRTSVEARPAPPRVQACPAAAHRLQLGGMLINGFLERRSSMGMPGCQCLTHRPQPTSCDASTPLRTTPVGRPCLGGPTRHAVAPAAGARAQCRAAGRAQELVCVADSEVEAVVAYRNALENALGQPAAAHPVEGYGASNLSLAQARRRAPALPGRAWRGRAGGRGPRLRRPRPARARLQGTSESASSWQPRLQALLAHGGSRGCASAGGPRGCQLAGNFQSLNGPGRPCRRGARCRGCCTRASRRCGPGTRPPRCSPPSRHARPVPPRLSLCSTCSHGVCKNSTYNMRYNMRQELVLHFQEYAADWRIVSCCAQRAPGLHARSKATRYVTCASAPRRAQAAACVHASH